MASRHIVFALLLPAALALACERRDAPQAEPALGSTERRESQGWLRGSVDELGQHGWPVVEFMIADRHRIETLQVHRVAQAE